MTLAFSHWARRLYIISALSLILVGCGGEAAPGSSELFLKAEPAVDAELDLSPGSLRVYFSKSPDPGASSMTLIGEQGEIPLSGLHTMGEDDLMIGIDQYPLAAGLYTVQWTARFAGDDQEFSGSYNFTVKAAPQ